MTANVVKSETQYLYWSEQTIQTSQEKPCCDGHPKVYTKTKESVENNTLNK